MSSRSRPGSHRRRPQRGHSLSNAYSSPPMSPSTAQGAHSSPASRAGSFRSPSRQSSLRPTSSSASVLARPPVAFSIPSVASRPGSRGGSRGNSRPPSRPGSVWGGGTTLSYTSALNSPSNATVSSSGTGDSWWITGGGGNWAHRSPATVRRPRFHAKRPTSSSSKKALPSQWVQGARA